jgi:hypothetical protein
MWYTIDLFDLGISPIYSSDLGGRFERAGRSIVRPISLYPISSSTNLERRTLLSQTLL